MKFFEERLKSVALSVFIVLASCSPTPDQGSSKVSAISDGNDQNMRTAEEILKQMRAEYPEMESNFTVVQGETCPSDKPTVFS